MSKVTAASATNSKSKSISQYIKTISESNIRTGYEYLKRLESFQGFIAQNYDFTIDDLTLSKMFSVNVYELLSSYVSYLINKTSDDGYSISSLTIKQRVTTLPRTVRKRKGKSTIFGGDGKILRSD
jgi:hypothetical protein